MRPLILRWIMVGPSAFEALVPLLPPELLDVKIDPDRFSAREVVAHVADWELVFQSRFRLAVEHPGSTFNVVDEVERGEAMGYAQASPTECVQRFRTAREATAEYLEGLEDGQFENTVVHGERGKMSLGELVGILIGHDLYHVQQLAAYLAIPADAATAG